MNEFEEYLLRLSDSSFFALYRNYLGPEKSPVRKHALIRELRAFFSRPKTVDRVFSYIDDEETEILAAVDLLPAPGTDALVRFFDGEPGPASIQRLLSNLLDRMVLIRDGSGLPRLNPLIAAEIRSRVTDNYQLVRFVPDRETAATQRAGPWMTVNLACALRSFLAWSGTVFTRSGAVRRSARNALDEAFPALFAADAEGESRFARAIEVLSRLGLVERDDEGNVTPVDVTWEELGDLPYEWVNLLLWSAPLAESVEAALETGNTLRDLFAQWPDGTGLDRRGFRRAVMLIEPATQIETGAVDLLVELGVLVEIDSRLWLPDATRRVLATTPDPSNIVLQANMEVVFTDAPPVATAFALSEVCEIVAYDRAPHFVLTERSVMRAYQSRGSALPLLQGVAALPQNVRFNVSRWEERARSVRIRRAVVLQVSDEAARMVAASPTMADLGAEAIGKNIFLFPEGSADRLEAALRDMGVSAIVESTRGDPGSDVPHFARLAERYRQSQLFRSVPGFTPAENETTPAKRDVASPHDLDAALEKLEHDEGARRELSLRIDRKLILFPEQLQNPAGGGALTEARGLDYLGKVRIIEQAIADDDLLEAVFRAGEGTPERILCRPLELDRTGDDLMVRGRREPDGKAVRIRVRRISVVRRFSGTLIREFRENR